MKRLTVGILAHVDAGKTTLCEALLYLSGQIRKLGRVDRRDSWLDGFDQERQRGITIFSKQAQLEWKGCEITLLDTPGHADFQSEMERTLQILDCAVLVISGTDGVQAHTDTLRMLLSEYRIPTFVFITKMDVSSLTRRELMDDMRAHFSENCLDFSAAADTDERNEAVALLDEQALDEYTETGTIGDAQISRLVAERRLVPCFFGSGLRLDGAEEFLDALVDFTQSPVYPEAFGAKVYKISRDAKGRRMTFLKVTGGSISVRSPVRYLPAGEEGSAAIEEKISEIRFYSGHRFTCADSAPAGSVCAVIGLSGTLPGSGLGIESDSDGPLLEPVLGYSVILPPGTDARAVLPKLRQLEEEDPQLHVGWNEGTGEISIHLMGAVQTEILRETVRERFDTDIQFGPGRILYRETVADAVEGVGHYEPLRHYAEVHLLIEPDAPGSGITLCSSCSTDELELNWQRLIMTHLSEKRHAGVLTGSPLTDVRITLLSGKAHLKHTEGGDFRQATYRAVRQGLMQAKNVLLEPVFDYSLEVPSAQIGRAISDLHAMGGEHDSPKSLEGDRMLICGRAPVSKISGYATDVASYTGGRGRFFCRPGGYMPCADADAVIEAAGYDPEADTENPPGSVFCAHGAGFYVKWDEVFSYMHLPSVLRPAAPDSPRAAAKSAPAPRAGSSHDIDEKELESIMEREFGPIRRKQYSAATVNAAPKPSAFVPRRERLIVDGYNLIFAWDELRKLASGSLESAREKLTGIIADYCGFRDTEAALVFDAYRVPGGTGERFDSGKVHVAFTRENESADLYIERLADEIGKNENVRVVTSDSLIRLTALRAGVLRTSSKDFIAELEDTLSQIREFTEKK